MHIDAAFPSKIEMQLSRWDLFVFSLDHYLGSLPAHLFILLISIGPTVSFARGGHVLAGVLVGCLFYIGTWLLLAVCCWLSLFGRKARGYLLERVVWWNVEGIGEQSAENETKLAWADVRQVRIQRDAVAVYWSRTGAIFIPQRYFASRSTMRRVGERLAQVVSEAKAPPSAGSLR